MSRYRPPRSAGTALITPEGEARMRAELHELWHVRRPQVTQSVSEAAAQGDRSENAEYTYGKKMLREIDSRVRFLTKRLENLKVVDSRPSDPNKVYFGAWVSLEDDDGHESRYRIVGPDELDLKNPANQHRCPAGPRPDRQGPGCRSTRADAHRGKSLVYRRHRIPISAGDRRQAPHENDRCP